MIYICKQINVMANEAYKIADKLFGEWVCVYAYSIIIIAYAFGNMAVFALLTSSPSIRALVSKYV